MLHEKRKELGDAASKLRNGLDKIDDTRAKVWGFIYLLRTVPTNTEVFCVVYDYARKADLSKGYWNPKTKLGVATHFSEIIKQQYF